MTRSCSRHADGLASIMICSGAAVICTASQPDQLAPSRGVPQHCGISKRFNQMHLLRNQGPMPLAEEAIKRVRVVAS